tara:strand:- start:13620 stop:14123 length:504 start_codon:yes stop_codon:yes gene_type:complete
MKQPSKTLRKNNKKNTIASINDLGNEHDDSSIEAEDTVLNHKQKMARLVKNTLQLVLGFLIIMLFLSIAKIITIYFSNTFPASIVGMLMLFIALSLGIIKLSWIEFAGNLVMKYLALLFIPIGVGLINYFDLIATHWLVIIFSLFFTTLLTLFLVGHCYQWLVREEQ